MKKYRIHPLFIAYVFLLVLIGQSLSVLWFFLAVILHELGHSFVAKKLGYKLDKLTIMPYGVCLNYNTKCFYGNDEIYIALAGPLVNLFLIILTVAFWWIFPITYNYTYLFCYANIMLFSFNFLPCYPLDGGRILVGLVSKKLQRKYAIKISIIFNIIISIIFVLIFIFGLFIGIKNFNLIIISLFLLGGILDPNNYSKYNLLEIKKKPVSLSNKAIAVKFICVNSQMPIYKILPKMSRNKFNVIYIIMKNKTVKIINENSLEIIIQKYSSLCRFEDVFELYL